MSINLFSSYYTVEDRERQKEIDFCYEANLKNPLIDGHYYFDKGRPTYDDFFNWMADFPNDINILANSDIYFNETIGLASSVGFKSAYALTRWEERDGGIVRFSEAHSGQAKSKHSQDVWIFQGKPRIRNAYFCLGQPGCDNKIAYMIRFSGYNVTNPSESIQAIHRHKEDSREYNMPKVNGPYHWIEPTKL